MNATILTRKLLVITNHARDTMSDAQVVAVLREIADSMENTVSYYDEVDRLDRYIKED